MELFKQELKINFLGISASGPTKDRNASIIYGETNQQVFLLDVAENAQQRIMQKNLKLMVDFIFISHTHIDHNGGLIPILKTMYKQNRSKPLNLYVPDENYYTKLLKLNNSNYMFVNLIQVIPGVKYLQKDLWLEFYDRKHGLNIVKTMGIRINSSKSVKYSKEKIKEAGFNSLELKELFSKGNLKKNDNNYSLKDLEEPFKEAIDVYYTSDGRPDITQMQALSKKKGTLYITECTHYDPEDRINSLKTEHTHYQQLKPFFNTQSLMVLTHLGQKITPYTIKAIEKKDSLKESNIIFAEENMIVLHDLKTNSNIILKKGIKDVKN